MTSQIQTVLILGASDKPDRYSFRALKMLQNHGHHVVLVHPTLKEIEGQKVYASLAEVKEKIDTITVYINSNLSLALQHDLIKLKPKRVIFNPGAENEELSIILKNSQIETEDACTLVLLSTGQF